MGLAIVHSIVKNYGGFITFSSQLGKGTVFHVNLPEMASMPPCLKTDRPSCLLSAPSVFSMSTMR